MPEPPATGKNIVLCFDGTGDWATLHTTNVLEIYNRLDKEKQAVFYAGGVGTLGNSLALSRSRRIFLKLLDLAVATSLRDRVLEGYEFLVQNYNKGDKIFLFGFSRGAFTARVLAALIYNFGLLERRNANLIPYLWQSISEFASFGQFIHDAKTIKETFSTEAPEQGHEPYAVEVDFLGLFDTVSSVGIFQQFKVFPYTDRNPAVRTARHAVSKDEDRNGFPELLLIPDTKTGNDIGEVWFDGVHRDIGGGAKSDRGLSQDTLNWMMQEAAKCGLILDTTPQEPDKKKPHYAFFDPYTFVGLYPMRMFDYRIEHRERLNWSFPRIVDELRTWYLTHKYVQGGGQDPAKYREDLRARDPGFRWFWPNFKHPRTMPQNAFEHLPNGKVRDHCTGNEIELGDVECQQAPSPRPIEAKRLFSEFVGILLGVTLAFLVANRGMGEPFGDSWPGLTAQIALGVFLLYTIEQGFSQWLSVNKLGWLDRLVEVMGLILPGWLIWYTWDDSEGLWLPLLYGLGTAFFVALISLVGKRPKLVADRAVPLFFVPWVMIVVGLWAIPPSIDYLAGHVSVVWEWFGGDRIRSRLVRSDYPTYIAWGLAVFAGVTAIAQIVQDRRKMSTESKCPEPKSP